MRPEMTPADRRRSQRHDVNSDVFVVFRSDSSRLGKLKDVSTGGIAFEYPLFPEYEGVLETNVDIFASQPDFFLLSSVSCKVVYDVRIKKPTFNAIETRRCGLEFTYLSEQQGKVLDFLLTNYVIHS